MNPEPKSPTETPRAIERKREPAAPCPICKSPSTVGIRGARMILEMTLRKCIPTRQSRSGI
jgi:hypothetical protein